MKRVKKPESWVEYLLLSTKEKLALFRQDQKGKSKAERTAKKQPPKGGTGDDSQQRIRR